MTDYHSPYTAQPHDEWTTDDYDLFDVDGDKVGDILEVNPDFVVAQSEGGFLGLTDDRMYFVPRGYIGRQDGDAWYMSIDMDEIESMDWRTAPVASAWSQDWSTGHWPLERADAVRVRRYEDDLHGDKVQRQVGEAVVTKND